MKESCAFLAAVLDCVKFSFTTLDPSHDAGMLPLSGALLHVLRFVFTETRHCLDNIMLADNQATICFVNSVGSFFIRFSLSATYIAMVHFVRFLTRSLTDDFSPIFEIIYTAEATILAFIILILPVIAWIAANGVPLHRNLRCIFVCAIVHGWLGAIGRTVLLAGQILDTDCVEWDYALTAASFGRRMFLMYFAVLFFGITIERFVATLSWSWYEKQGSATLAVLTAILITQEITSIVFAYQETFANSGTFEYASFVFTIFTGIVAASGIVYLVLLYFNIRGVAKLSRQGADQYSLARSYQLRENVAVMKMILRLSVPVSIICIPTFIFFGGFILLPYEYTLLRRFSVAMFDLSIGVDTLITSLVFPLFEERFRRPAFRLRIYRWFTPTRFQCEHGKRVVKNSRVTASDVYFDWLNRDLN